ncbi:conserved exported hypothetical protein [uncultured Paludibacter sp.]|uniref:Uncharacterized protein n=1 Tax=uncultured Paludibacter sp. TaxID=497635 RepID=A0A653ADR3_9BACT|nr:conserved exported hypothetical protein [uncultured Paludibacter sp.]
MKLLKYKHSIFFLLSLIAFGSCNLNTSNTINVSDDATITAFSINYNDSSENASSAVFTITNGYTVDTIRNLDSLPYNTRIDSLIPSITTSSTSGFIVNDTLTYYLTVSKAINFTSKVKITNVASDGETKKDYIIDVRVHKVDPYLYVWTKLSDKINASVYENQKTLFFKGKFHFYTSSVAGNYAYSSSDASAWSSETLTGLPLGVSFQNMDTLNSKIFLLSGNDIYTSLNGTDWALVTTDNKYTYKAMICEYESKLYAIGQDKTTNAYRIINSADGSNWNEAASEFLNDFPVSGFASTSFQPKYGNKKIIVVGGYNANGKKLNTRWTTEDGVYWVNLQNPKSPFDAISNAALTYYGSKLLLVGGTDISDEENVVTGEMQVRNSLDEGLTWGIPDSTQNVLPENFKYRKNTSLVINPINHALYIIGGADNLNPLSDVWKLQVNYYKFDPSEWYKY